MLLMLFVTWPEWLGLEGTLGRLVASMGRCCLLGPGRCVPVSTMKIKIHAGWNVHPEVDNGSTRGFSRRCGICVKEKACEALVYSPHPSLSHDHHIVQLPAQSSSAHQEYKKSPPTDISTDASSYFLHTILTDDTLTKPGDTTARLTNAPPRTHSPPSALTPEELPLLLSSPGPHRHPLLVAQPHP